MQEILPKRGKLLETFLDGEFPHVVTEIFRDYPHEAHVVFLTERPVPLQAVRPYLDGIKKWKDKTNSETNDRSEGTK